MRLARLFVCALLSVLLITTLSAQEPATEAAGSPAQTKEQTEVERRALILLDQQISQAANLKLAENRVYIFSQTANLLWKRDEKRARALFRRAADELIAADNLNENEELPENFGTLRNVRVDFLNSLASRDAEFALELLLRTRPPALNLIINLPTAKSALYGNLNYDAQNEISLERQITAQTFRTNPRRALETARANLNKNVLSVDLNLINQLKTVDRDAASQFADEVVQKLMLADFAEQQNYAVRGLATSFFSQFAAQISPPQNDPAEQSKQLQINQSALRRLAEKYADYLASNSININNYHELENVLGTFNKILPERAARLRQKLETLQRQNSAANPQNALYERLNRMSESAAPETMLQQAGDFPIGMRAQLYTSAANKMAQTGNAAVARQTLALVPGKQARQSALTQFDQQIFNNFLNQKKFQEAEQIIGQQTDNNVRINFLVALARALREQKQPEKASQYIAEARALVVFSPENPLELFGLIQVLGASAEVEPEKTFELLESFVLKFNEILQAAAFLSKYQEQSSIFRDGELILPNGYGGIYVNSRTMGFQLNADSFRLGSLAKTDFARAAAFVDRFDRSDMRIAARQIVLNSVLQDEKTQRHELPQQSRMRMLTILE